MSPERERETRKFRSEESSSVWGLWCGVAFWTAVILGVIGVFAGWV